MPAPLDALLEPAFPGPAQSSVPHDLHTGMTLRDWFAGQAMAPLITMYGQDSPDDELMTREAYQIADAMMAARAKA